MKQTLIVCHVEFSAEGRSALVMALALARWYDAELHVAHVGPRLRAESRGIRAGVVDHELSARLDDFTAAVNVEGTKVEAIILHGDPVGALVDYTRSMSAGLAVVAQNGRRGSPYWSAGAFAKEVARGVGCPTITVPSRSTPKTAATPFKNIVCGIDFSQSSAVALRHALVVAQQSCSRLTLLHVLERSAGETLSSESVTVRLAPEYRAHVDGLRVKLNSLVPLNALNSCEIETEVVSGTAREAIVVTAAARGADLIVVGQPQTTLHHVVMASTVGAVLRRAQCPVLTVPGAQSVEALLPY